MAGTTDLSSVAASDAVLRAGRAASRVLPRSTAERVYAAYFRTRWGFAPPPPWSDWTGYENLMTELARHGIADVPGDVVEIGVLLGGGTYKLCRWLERAAPGKRVIAVDIFDPDMDVTRATTGDTMAELYATALAGRSQRDVFDEVTAGLTNLVVVQGDSAAVELPVDQLAFAYVDGNHSAEYVRNDFELVWSRLSPGGAVAFDDYGRDLPEVTHALHECIGRHASEVARVWTGAPKTLYVQRER